MTSQPSSIQPALPGTPVSKVRRAFRGVLGVAGYSIYAMAYIWCAASMVASAWLIYQVPLSESDLSGLSILTPMFQITKPATAFGLLFLLCGLACLVVSLVRTPRTPWKGLSQFFAGVCFFLCVWDSVPIRYGIYIGDMKIGCYADSVECREMLGLPAGDAKSMYKAADRKEFAEWYAPIHQAALDKVGGESSAALGTGFLYSPMLAVKHLDELKARIAFQRQALAEYIQANRK